MKLRRLFSSFTLLALCAASVRAAETPPFVWIEGEKPASVTGVPKWDAVGWGRKELLSSETWFQINVGEDKTATDVAGDGAVVTYNFTVAEPGAYQVWNRVGYEFVRSPFEWRVDNGAWKTVKPTDLTTDLQAIETWNEVAWIQLGDAPNLTAGTHKLEIRLTRQTKADGKPDKLLYASDALCLTRGTFTPNGKYKPGETRNAPEDKTASGTVFSLIPPDPVPSGIRPVYPLGEQGQRYTIKLSGLWEVCRADEQLPKPVAEPFEEMPAEPIWTAIPVPSDKNESRPDLLFAHRLWYRTRLNVGADTVGKSFAITFPQNSLNTTVVVNGVLCGFNKNPHAPFTVDITKGIKPGANEIRVGIRDAWYAYTASPTNPMKLRKQFNLPLSVVGGGFQDLSYPVWHAWQSGILIAPTVTATGNIYASDVFVKPSVAKKTLTVEVQLTSVAKSNADALVSCEVLDASGKVVHTLPAQTFPVPVDAKKTVEVSGAWENPTLWWPDSPTMYTLHTTVSIGGKITDTSETPFGFREWGSRGKDFLLNGVVWHGWADLNGGGTPAEWLKAYRASGQRFMRLAGYAQGGQTWNGMNVADALDFFDREGVVVRRSGILDGEAIGYNAIENDPELRKLYGSETKVELQNNWRDQMVQRVKAERNHPSIHLWSVENEWLYINCINLYGDKMDEFETRAKDVMDAVSVADPTRLSMVDGGGAGKNQLFPVHGDHYVYNGDPSAYPAVAYEANPTGGGRGRWVWDEKRPRYLGEDYFATGINPADYAYIGGESTFQGKAATREAAGLIQTMLTEGYRWAGYGAYHFWLGHETATDQYNSFAPIAAFVKEWDSTFASGARITRTMGLFNDSYHETSPLTFSWTLTGANGKPLGAGKVTKSVAPGESVKFPVAVTMPTVAPGSRLEAVWKLSVSANGKTVFSDKKQWSVLGKPVMRRAGTVAATVPVSAVQNVFVYDPVSNIAKSLSALGFAAKPVLSLGALPTNVPIGTVLIVGKDALTPTESASSSLAAWASAGRTVIVLEQKNPLRYQGLPVAVESTSDTGNFAFADDLNHPVLRGLAQKDFFTWQNGAVYTGAYKKPATGGRSLVQCHNRLEDSALLEIPAGKGLLILSQLRVAETLSTNAVAARLLTNLVNYGASYRQTFRPVAAMVGAGTPIAKALTATGATFTPATDALTPLKDGRTKLAVVEATPANLKTLAANKPVVDAFTKNGGYLLLCNLTPVGLADYNRVVGVNHMIRPFRRERVTFPATKNPLMAGLSLGDVVMQSGQRINNFTSDVYLASDVFTYAVDYDEVASFAKLPEPAFFGNADAANDHDPYNMVNGFYSSDGWQYIFSMWAGSGAPKAIPFTFAVPQEITRFEWAGNAFYLPTTKVELAFDGKSPVSFATEPNNEPQTFAVRSPGAVKEVGLRIADWQKKEGVTSIVGVDNVRMFAKRPSAFYKSVRPLLSVGTLMEYPHGTGGIVLSNILFQDTESNPENGAKKARILGAILRNLKAPFGGGTTVLAGVGLNYTPVNISKQATQYRNATGWFGDKAFTFDALPSGKQTFAGVMYQIYDFPTSPVPTAIMLKGDGVPGNLPDAVRGIPVGKKAAALFFLHTARMDNRRNNDERRDNKRYEMARYIVHYADGKTETVPVYAEIDIDDYKQEGEIRQLPGAQTAWTRAYPGTNFSAVAYQKQWTNPRPDVLIASVDMEYGSDRRGVPVLLALTAATTKDVK